MAEEGCDLFEKIRRTGVTQIWKKLLSVPSLLATQTSIAGRRCQHRPRLIPGLQGPLAIGGLLWKASPNLDIISGLVSALSGQVRLTFEIMELAWRLAFFGREAPGQGGLDWRLAWMLGPGCADRVGAGLASRLALTPKASFQKKSHLMAP